MAPPAPFSRSSSRLRRWIWRSIEAIRAACSPRGDSSGLSAQSGVASGDSESATLAVRATSSRTQVSSIALPGREAATQRAS